MSIDKIFLKQFKANNKFIDAMVSIINNYLQISDMKKLLSCCQLICNCKDIFEEKVNNNKDYTYSLITRVIQALNLRKTNKYICEAGISNYSVSVLGDIYPCFMLTDIEKFKIGNVYDSEVFDGVQYKNIINKLGSFSKFKDSKCENCFNNKICIGCIGSIYFKTGYILDSIEVVCFMYSSLTEKVILELASAN